MDTLFFYLSKIFWQLIKPETIFLLALLVGLVLLWLKRTEAARLILTITAVFACLFTFFPVGEWLAYPLEVRNRDQQLPVVVHGIIVLGGALNPRDSHFSGQSQLNSAAERLTAFVELARRYPQARLIFTGGNGEILDQQYPEADYAADFFNSVGLDSTRIQFERNSRNTYENALNTTELFSTSQGQHWILITSAQHMPRSLGVFCKQDKRMIPYAVDYNTAGSDLLRIEINFADNLATFNKAMREWIGLYAYYFTGKTDNFLPSSCFEL